MFGWTRKKDGDCQAASENVNNALREIKNLLSLSIIQGRNIMSKITDFAAAEGVSLAAISATLDSIVAGVAALDTLINNFQNSPGALTPADQAALDGIQAASAALVTKAAAISVTPPVPPAV
jgi:hypothetical protein